MSFLGKPGNKAMWEGNLLKEFPPLGSPRTPRKPPPHCTLWDHSRNACIMLWSQGAFIQHCPSIWLANEANYSQSVARKYLITGAPGWLCPGYLSDLINLILWPWYNTFVFISKSKTSIFRAWWFPLRFFSPGSQFWFDRKTVSVWSGCCWACFAKYTLFLKR